MIYFVYDKEEKDYHDLEKTTCDCEPSVKFLETGDMIIAHNCLAEPNKYTEKQMKAFVESAIDKIMGKKV